MKARTTEQEHLKRITPPSAESRPPKPQPMESLLWLSRRRETKMPSRSSTTRDRLFRSTGKARARPEGPVIHQLPASTLPLGPDTNAIPCFATARSRDALVPWSYGTSQPAFGSFFVRPPRDVLLAVLCLACRHARVRGCAGQARRKNRRQELALLHTGHSAEHERGVRHAPARQERDGPDSEVRRGTPGSRRPRAGPAVYRRASRRIQSPSAPLWSHGDPPPSDGLASLSGSAEFPGLTDFHPRMPRTAVVWCFSC